MPALSCCEDRSVPGRLTQFPPYVPRESAPWVEWPRQGDSWGLAGIVDEPAQLVPRGTDGGVGKEQLVVRHHGRQPLSSLRKVKVCGVRGLLQPLVDPVGARATTPRGDRGA